LFVIKNNDNGGHVLNVNLCWPHANAGIATCRPHPLPCISPVKVHGESPFEGAGGGVQVCNMTVRFSICVCEITYDVSTENGNIMCQMYSVLH